MGRFWARIKGARGGEVIRRGNNHVEAHVHSRTLGVKVRSGVNLKTGEECFWIYVTSGTCESFNEQLVGVITRDNALKVSVFDREYVERLKRDISNLQGELSDQSMFKSTGGLYP